MVWMLSLVVGDKKNLLLFLLLDPPIFFNYHIKLLWEIFGFNYTSPFRALRGLK